MPNRRTFIEQNSGSRRAVRCFVLALLFAVSWQGPIPWIHAHPETLSAESFAAGEFAAGQGAERASLSSEPFQHHVLRFHGHAEGDPGDDWHMHFLMPMDLPGPRLPPGENGEKLPWDELGLATAVMASWSTGIVRMAHDPLCDLVEMMADRDAKSVEAVHVLADNNASGRTDDIVPKPHPRDLSAVAIC